MEVYVVNESGYEQAVEGIGYSFGVRDWGRLVGVAEKLCDKDGGHNKFLESIVVWVVIRAARYWWQEFDTYRVGTTKQSESTIHTLCKKPLTEDDFEEELIPGVIHALNVLIDKYKVEEDRQTKHKLFRKIKGNLPEGYLQKRMVCTNYKVLSNMIAQRKNHVLDEWKENFINTVLRQIQHPELLLKRYGGESPCKSRG